MKNIIEVKNLTKDYGYERGVFDISFEVREGETFGFLGPNGSGKTTTIRHLLGFSKPQKGKTTIFGRDSFTYYSKNLKDVGYIPGELAFPSGLTGFEVIKMMQDLVGRKNLERLKMLCERFRLDEIELKSYPRQMSLGTKRKLAIVVAFMSDPSVLILDEPTSGLDPIMQDVFIDFIKNEKRRGKTILLSSHIFNEVDQTCDRISIIKEGRIIDTFVADDFRHDKHKFYSIKFKNNIDYIIFLDSEMDFINIIDKNPSNYEVLISTHDEHIDKVVNHLSRFEIEEFTNIKETLEEYFLKYYKECKEFGGLK